MKLKAISWILVFILVFCVLIIPIYAEPYSSTQSVSVTVPTTTATSMTYVENNNSKIVPLLLFGNIDYIGNLYLTNPSNKNIELWIKAEGFNTESGNVSSGIKYWIQGTDNQGELTNYYTKAGVLNKPKQGSQNPNALNVQIGMSSKNISENSAPIMYVTTINSDSTAPTN